MWVVLVGLLIFGLLSNTKAIFDGTTRKIEDIPYLAAIISSGNLVGTGTLLNKRYILTKVNPSLTSSAHVLLGSSKISDKGLKINILSTQNHPNPDFVLTLVYLEQEVADFTPSIQPIQLTDQAEDPNVQFVIAAFGRNYDQGEPGQLNSVNVRMAGHDKCKDVTNYNTDRHACFRISAYDEEAGLPMVHDGILYGIGSAQFGSQHVMTRIYPALEWIKEVTETTTTSRTTAETSMCTSTTTSSSNSTIDPDTNTTSTTSAESTESSDPDDDDRSVDAARSLSNFNYQILITLIFFYFFLN